MQTLKIELSDVYPAISTDEAKKRVSDAVGRYRNGAGVYLDSDKYDKHKSEIINSLKSKYANN